jgi:hypothetical protein
VEQVERDRRTSVEQIIGWSSDMIKFVKTEKGQVSERFIIRVSVDSHGERWVHWSEGTLVYEAKVTRDDWFRFLNPEQW